MVMQALPSVAVPAFHALTRLFDLYFYTVACSFIPQVAMHSVFAYFEAMEAGGAPASAADDQDAFPFKDPIGAPHMPACMCVCVRWRSLRVLVRPTAIAIAREAAREYGAADFESKKKSTASSARERVSLARRMLQQAGAGGGECETSPPPPPLPHPPAPHHLCCVCSVHVCVVILRVCSRFR